VDAKLAYVRAIVYLRISSDRTGQEAGVDRQREDCLERCAQRGWDVVAVEADNDISASSGKRRPGFEALLEAVSRGSVDVVVAWAVDRLQRSRRDEARLYELCQRAGVLLSLVKGSDLDFSTAAGRFVADSLGSVARMEVEMKSERQQRAQLQSAQQGKRSTGRRPFGYEDDGVTVRPAEAAAIRDGYRSLLAGVSLSEIARTWNAAGFTTGQTMRDAARTPSSWRRDSVRFVLLNPRNAGHRAYKGEIVAKAEWPALVEDSTYQAAVALLTHPDRTGRPVGSRALLTGIALCGVCGDGTTVHAGGSTTRGVRNYRCPRGGHLARRAAPVDQYVSQVVIARLSRPDAHDLLVRRDLPDLDALRQEAVEYRTRLESLATDFADGALTGAQLRAATERLRLNLATVEARMADAGRVDVLGPLVTADDVATVWEALKAKAPSDADPDRTEYSSRQRAVIDALMVVTIHPPGRGVRNFDPASVQIDWRTS
jgi:site-specific DNA recombinase